MDLPIQNPSDIGRSSGSVKRAREKAERERQQIGLPGATSRSPPRALQGQQVQGGPIQSTRPRQPLPPAITASRTGQGIGASISRPTPAPQWPLPSQNTRPEMGDNSQQYQPPTGRGQAPQRPERPSHVPSILDASKVQDHTPSFPYQTNQGMSNPGSQSKVAQQHLEEMKSPDLMSPVTPLTTASRASTNSSVGTIPDFPVPSADANRGQTALGPPPSSRRGPSSYYSMQSFVSPIAEESPRDPGAHGSYASSTAIPSNWAEMGYGYDTDRQTLFDKETATEDREPEGEGVVRSASVGKRAKPSIVVTKNQEKTDQSRAGVLEKTKNLVNAGVIETAARKDIPQRPHNISQKPKVQQSAQRDTTWPTFGLDSPIEGNKELDDILSTSSDSDSTLASSPRAIEMEKLAPIAAVPAARTNSRSPNPRSPSGSPFEMDDKEIQYSRTSAIRRPPRLDMNAVRDAEARGSLTSLPDLIRRATRLASMMNEGKRPASRLNDLNDFPPLGGSREKVKGRHRNTPSGLSGMLAAFPPPGLATPLATPKSGTRWPAPYEESSLRGLQTPRDGESPPKRGRRCCGMPLCWFLVLVAVVLIVIAAAVVVPLELLVIHKKVDDKSLSPLELCDKNSPCSNGGASILNGASCSCICINGFTGTTCDEKSSIGCATISFTTDSTTYDDVTIGSSIPDLVTNGPLNYGIPLSFAPILSKFSSANLSCDAENAIVSFNPGSSSLPQKASKTAPSATGPTSVVSGTGNTRKRRVDAADAPLVPRTEESSSSSHHSTSATPTKSHSSSATPTKSHSSTATPSSTGTVNFIVSDDTLDFARVAVMYVLQTRTLDDAATAQTKITSFLVSGGASDYQSAGNVTIGESVTIDFLSFSVDTGKGVLGGRADAGVRPGSSGNSNDKRGAGVDTGFEAFGSGILGKKRRASGRLTGQRNMEDRVGG